VLILAGCALWVAIRVPVIHAKTSAPANPLPDLRGQEAVEHLKQEGLYDTLAGAVAAARYNADPMPSGDAYQFSNPTQGLRATFTSSGARFASTIDPLFTQQAKLVASDGAAEDLFGASVAISRNTVVLGAPSADTGGLAHLPVRLDPVNRIAVPQKHLGQNARA